ncbi:MAG: quinolinate synthase NadA [Bacteroidales bacterium]|nr:quinolinate synthase NadA [Bacteroidales bacterium]
MHVNNYNIKEKGFIDSPIDPKIDMVEEIGRMKKEKNAILLAHYYQTNDIQNIADFLGDSLKLSQVAAETNADIIIFAGVHFMAETAKILSPEKQVIIPDLNAGCSLADSCPPEEFKKFKDKYPDHTVISYVNTTAKIKTMTDICCTSTNALHIVNYLPKEENILFAPDKNLGNYIKRMSGRENMVVYPGSCHVHEEFSTEKIVKLKNDYPNAKIIAHPECEKPILIMADHVGSTSSLLKFTNKDDARQYIVATESGIIHQMKRQNPEKQFIVAPPKDSTCGCSECNFMKLITMEKIYNSLKYEQPTVELDRQTLEQAKKPIKQMLDISKELNL